MLPCFLTFLEHWNLRGPEKIEISKGTSMQGLPLRPQAYGSGAPGNPKLGQKVAAWAVGCGQNQWYHFGVGAPPILVYFSWDWDVHWGHGLLTHGHFQSQHSQPTGAIERLTQISVGLHVCDSGKHCAGLRMGKVKSQSTGCI